MVAANAARMAATRSAGTPGGMKNGRPIAGHQAEVFEDLAVLGVAGEVLQHAHVRQVGGLAQAELQHDDGLAGRHEVAR